MRIGIVTPSYYPNMVGGSEVSVKLLAEYLAKKGHQPIVFAFDGQRYSEETVDGIKVVRYRTFAQYFWPLTLLPFVSKAMKKWEEKVDIYHIYNVAPLPGAGLYKVRGGKKRVVATLNSYLGFCPINESFNECWACSFGSRMRCTVANQRSLKAKLVSFPYVFSYPFLTKLSKQIDQYIALSCFVKRIYVNFGFNPEKIQVIPNFADSKLANKKNVVSDRKSELFTILYVGRLSREKGIDILINAFWKLSQTRNDLRLYIVGTGTDSSDYFKLVSRLKLDEKVTFFGHLSNDELPKIYSAADVMVHPGIWPEPFGRTLLEAMTFDVPLIVSSAGTPPEIVGSAGLVFKCGNVNDLIKKMVAVLDDDGLLCQIRLNCSKVLAAYALNEVLQRIEHLYYTLLGYTPDI